jgi:hypothetical protein
MAQLTNPQAITFANEVVRPLAEEARAFSIRLGAMRTAWYGGMNALFANAGDTVEDGRESEGVSRLTAGDVTNLIAQLIAVAPGEAGAFNTEIIQKPCVRTLP